MVFSINCFVGMLLALYVAFTLDLADPAWAMLTVYITSSPLSGAVRAKAVYRLVGTLVGAGAMLAMVPNLVDSPELTTLAIALWVGMCLYISLLDRTPRSYVFALAGYTAALIGFPSVTAPQGVFDLAVARVEEIGIGTLCAATAHSLIFPRSVASVLKARLAVMLKDARAWISAGLTVQPMPAPGLAAAISDIAILGTNLPFDTAVHRPAGSAVRLLDERLVAVMPLVDAINERVGILVRCGPLPSGVTAVLEEVRAWVQTADVPDDRRAKGLVQACRAVIPELNASSTWADTVTLNLLERLIELVESWRDCQDLAAELTDPQRSANLRSKTAPIGGAAKPLHADHGIAALSGLAVVAAIVAATLFWIVTAWPQGASAVAFASVVCSLFATLDDPAPTIRLMIIIDLIVVPIVFTYEFAIFPAIDGFPLLALALAPVLLAAGYAMAVPKYAAAGSAVALTVCIQLALQSSYRADAASFLNTQVALVIGFMVGLVITRLTRTIGVQTSARRLIRAGFHDLAGIASGRLQISRTAWASRMLDRVGLLLPRLGAAGETPQLQYMATLKELRMGVNMIELQALRDSVEAPGRVLLETLLQHASEHFRARAHGLQPQPSRSLLDGIDGLIRTLLTDPLISSRHTAVVAAVGLRCSLFPNAEPYAYADPTGAAAPRASPRDSS